MHLLLAFDDFQNQERIDLDLLKWKRPWKELNVNSYYVVITSLIDLLLSTTPAGLLLPAAVCLWRQSWRHLQLHPREGATANDW